MSNSFPTTARSTDSYGSKRTPATWMPCAPPSSCSTSAPFVSSMRACVRETNGNASWHSLILSRPMRTGNDLNVKVVVCW